MLPLLHVFKTVIYTWDEFFYFEILLSENVVFAILRYKYMKLKLCYLYLEWHTFYYIK